MQFMSMQVQSNAGGGGNPASIGFIFGPSVNRELAAARMIAWWASLAQTYCGTSFVTGITHRVSGVPGTSDLSFPAAEYTTVRGWPMPPPPLPTGFVQPPVLSGYGGVITGLGDAPLGTSILVTERVGEFDELGVPVGPGPNGRVFFPWTSSSAVQNGVLITSGVTAVRRGYEWYLLSEGNPDAAARAASRPWVANRGSTPGTFVYRQIIAVNVRQRLAHLRSRSR